MRSIEEKAEKIRLFSPKRLPKTVITDLSFLKENLQSAVVVKHSTVLHKMIKKIILCSEPPASHKIFSVAPNHIGEKGDSFTKGLNNTKKCHENLSFRLAYLERLLLEDQINLREFKQFKAVLVKSQLASIREGSKKNHEKPVRINARTLSSLKKTADDHIHSYTHQYTPKNPL